MPRSNSEYINNARSFSPKDSNHPLVIAAIDRLSREICLGGSKKRKAHLKYFFLDLCARYRESPQGWIFYSRDSNYYSMPLRYNQLRLGRVPMLWVADQLKRYDLIEHKNGFYDRDTQKLYRSRARATPDLIAYFADIPASELKENLRTMDGIRLGITTKKRVKSKLVRSRKYIEYEGTPYIESMRNQILFFNEKVSEAHLDLCLLNTEGYEAVNAEATELRVNLNRKSLHRVFNQNFERGGRFYGGWWQNVPSDLRDHILIDGEPTIELDYKGFHIALLYALEGVDYYNQDDVDPYVVEGWDRDSVKLLLQVLLNSKNGNEAIAAFIEERRKQGLPTVPRSKIVDLLAKFESMHAPIAKYFKKVKGLELQNLDARIAQSVIHDCMETGMIDLDAAARDEIIRHKFLVLPIHDSFRVKVRYKEYLRRAMVNAIRNVGEELNYLDGRLFYHYTSRMHDSDLMDIQDLSNDSAYQNRKTLFQAGELLPDLKLFRKCKPGTNESYYKFDGNS